MRASLYLFGFAAASLVGAGLFEIGCSSSSTVTPAADAESEATTDDGGDDGGDGATPCTPVQAGTRADTIDGGAGWGCIQSACNSKALTACSSDCTCNNGVLTALLCVATDAGTATTCLTKALTPIIADPTVTALATCLMSAAPGCAGDGGTHPDAGDGGTHPDAGDGGSTPDASDGGTHPDSGLDAGLDASIDSGLTLDASDAGPAPADAADGG